MNTDQFEYRVGGAIPLESPTYIKRQADDELLKNLKAGHFCYVLNSRQMGKTSLLIQTKNKIEQDCACINIDLSCDIGTDVSPYQWYTVFFDFIADELNIS